jgi:hypothetical protein
MKLDNAARGREAALAIRRSKKEQRQAAVRELEERGVPRMQMRAELERLGFRASQGTLWNDLQELGYGQRRPRKHAPAEPRECAHPECSVVFTPAADLVARGGGRYCSPLCARRSPDSREWAREGMTYMHEEADRELARLNADGYLSLRQAAADVRVAENTLHRYAELGCLRTEPKRLISGEWLRPVRRDELRRFKREDWPDLRKRTERLWDDEHPPPTSWETKSRQRWIGRANGDKGTAAGIEASRQNVGRPRKWTDDDDEQEWMESQLRELGNLSARDAAEQVFGDQRFYKRVQRFRAA